MNNFDKEATKLNAINILSTLAIGETFISLIEEVSYISKKSKENQHKIEIINTHLMELRFEDQLLMARMALLLEDISCMLCEKYGFTEEDDFESNL